MGYELAGGLEWMDGMMDGWIYIFKKEEQKR